MDMSQPLAPTVPSGAGKMLAAIRIDAAIEQRATKAEPRTIRFMCTPRTVAQNRA